MARPEFERLERFDVPEIFADAFECMLTSDGCVYITLSVRRAEGVEPGGTPKAKQVTCCRLVLTIPAAGLMANQITNLLKVLENRGLLKRERDEPQTAQ